MCAYVCMRVCAVYMNVCVYVCMCLYVYACVCCVWVYVCVCVHMFVCMCMCEYMCMCVNEGSFLHLLLVFSPVILHASGCTFWSVLRNISV